MIPPRWVSLSLWDLFLDVMLFPGLLHLSLVQAMVKENVLVGAQNISANLPGAFTGEIAADHFRDYGIQWVLIGHSERRNLYGENEETVMTKVKQALQMERSMVICIGENLAQRQADQTNEVLAQQLKSLAPAFKDTPPNWDNIVIAYEPVWAIGTGKIASAD